MACTRPAASRRSPAATEPPRASRSLVLPRSSPAACARLFALARPTPSGESRPAEAHARSRHREPLPPAPIAAFWRSPGLHRDVQELPRHVVVGHVHPPTVSRRGPGTGGRVGLTRSRLDAASTSSSAATSAVCRVRRTRSDRAPSLGAVTSSLGHSHHFLEKHLVDFLDRRLTTHPCFNRAGSSISAFRLASVFQAAVRCSEIGTRQAGGLLRLHLQHRRLHMRVPLSAPSIVAELRARRGRAVYRLPAETHASGGFLHRVQDRRAPRCWR